MLDSKDEVITWDAVSMLEPDSLLPSQFHTDSLERLSGARGLLWAVFLDGIQTYCQAVSRRETHTLEYREANRWIFRPDSDAITSFTALCALFQIDPRRLRRRLLDYRETPSGTLAEIFELQAA